MRRRKSKFEIDKFRGLVAEINWSPLYEIDNQDLAYHFFETSNLEILDREAPMAAVQSSSRKKNWLTPETRTLIGNRNTARETATNSQNTQMTGRATEN